MSNTLFVANIPWTMTDSQLLATFQEFGNVLEAKIIMDRETNRSKGFGFVKFDNPVDAGTAKTKMNGVDIEGRSLVVDFAREAKRQSNRPRRYRDN